MTIDMSVTMNSKLLIKFCALRMTAELTVDRVAKSSIKVIVDLARTSKF